MNNDEKWLPTSIDRIALSFSFKSSDLLKRNLAYNIQYLQYLVKNIESNETTSVLYRMQYKSFIVTGMSVIEAIFIALLAERNMIPLECWKETEHKHNSIDDNTILVTFKRKRIPPKRKKIKLDEAIHLIEKNNVLGIKTNAFPALRVV